MLSAKLTFKARVLELGRGQEDSWGAYISSKLQMLPESGSVIQSCCYHHGAWDTQKVISFDYSTYHACAFKSLPQASSTSKEPHAGEGCRGEICLPDIPTSLTH